MPTSSAGGSASSSNPGHLRDLPPEYGREIGEHFRRRFSHARQLLAALGPLPPHRPLFAGDLLLERLPGIHHALDALPETRAGEVIVDLIHLQALALPRALQARAFHQLRAQGRRQRQSTLHAAHPDALF